VLAHELAEGNEVTSTGAGEQILCRSHIGGRVRPILPGIVCVHGTPIRHDGGTGRTLPEIYYLGGPWSPLGMNAPCPDGRPTGRLALFGASFSNTAARLARLMFVRSAAMDSSLLKTRASFLRAASAVSTVSVGMASKHAINNSAAAG
jgi:hypothetical protein